jgi:D-erythro-7,8-dihydroneopterin triphosphate epimerase
MAEYTDKIQLRDLRAACIIGVGPEERSSSQEVRIDLSLEVDLEPAGRSDRLEDTVDYGALAREVVAMVEGSSFQLLEKLAEEVAGLCLARSKVERVKVTVAKPHALPSGSASVTVLRDRDSRRPPMGFGRLV